MKSMKILFLGCALLIGGCAARVKGGGAKSASAAQMSKDSQKTGSTAKGSSSATSTGSDSGGVTCDASLDGVGFCDTDNSIVFCAGGSWYQLSCGAIAE